MQDSSFMHTVLLVRTFTLKTASWHSYPGWHQVFLQHYEWLNKVNTKFYGLKSCTEPGWYCDRGFASPLKSSYSFPTVCAEQNELLQTTNFVTSAVEAVRRRSEQLNCCSHLLEQQTAWPGEQPPDDGWRAAGNERLYQAALSSSSRSRQARFLSNCIGFSNFLFQDKWIEILRGEGVLIVCNPGVIITYDPFSISGLSRHVLVITLSTPRLLHLSVKHFDAAEWI